MSLPKELTTVTPLSKMIALIMFTLLPVIAFFMGIKYQQMESNLQILLIQENIMRGKKIPTPTPDSASAYLDQAQSVIPPGWEKFEDVRYSYSYPPSLQHLSKYATNSKKSFCISDGDVHGDVVIESTNRVLTSKFKDLTKSEFYNLQHSFWSYMKNSSGGGGTPTKSYSLTKVGDRQAVLETTMWTNGMCNEDPTDRIYYVFLDNPANVIYKIRFRYSSSDSGKQTIEKQIDEIITTFIIRR